MRLSVEDASVLALVNNGDINVNRAQYDLSRFAVERAREPFEPVVVAGYAPTRSISPTGTALSGASTLSALSQVYNNSYSQEFQTGTIFGVGFVTTRATTNSSFATVNPSFASGLTFSLSQPLWRKRGLFPNRAPIIIAQRAVRLAEPTFEGQLRDTLS